MIGKTISHYKILEHVGSGGMGDVWKAEDLDLKRIVALKFLSRETLDEEAVKARLIREAQAAASLDHPNVCPVYGIHDDDGQTFIAMAYIEGSTLAEKIKERPLPLDEAIAISIQIAEGLQEAHEHDVVHRDVKPANVMLDRKGRVKILDFGLAALGNRTRLTRAGTTLGTPAYMSPEQAQGQAVDRRTDVWALGVVLYEMLTGKHPFPGDYEQAVVYGIINEKAEPVTALRRGIPPKVDDLIAKALAKNPDERYQHVEEMIVDLQAMRRNGESVSAPRNVPPAIAGPAVNRMAIAALIVLVIAGAWLVVDRDSEREPVHTATPWSEPRRITSDPGLTFQPTISRDGTLLAYSSDRAGEGNLEIWVQQTAGGDPIQITKDPADDTSPHFSPDGKSIVFRSERDGGGVYVVPSLGGFERFLAPRGRRPRFSPDGENIAYYTGGDDHGTGAEVIVVAASGGVPRKFEVEALTASHPVWSPDGSALLVATQKGTFDEASYEWRVVTLGGIDRGATGALSAIRASAAASQLNYVPDDWGFDGFVWFSSDDEDTTDLWRIQVNPLTTRVVGEPERILPGPGTFLAAAVSGTGRVLFGSLTANEDVWSLPIDANRGVALSAEPTRLTSSSEAERYPSVSADGSIVTFQSDRTGSREQWLLSTVNGRERPVAAIVGHSVVNASGTQLAAGWVDSLAVVGLDGMAIDQLPGPGGYPWHFSPDDSMILFNRLEGRRRGIFLWGRDSGETTSLLMDQEQSYYQGQFSPDQRWVAWETSRGELQVARFRGARSIPPSERIQISNVGLTAQKPRWSPDGNLLYHLSSQDGFVCIYAQPLDPATKQPRGESVDLYHSHGTRNTIGNVEMSTRAISVASDKIVFSMSDRTGNIWLIEPVE